MSLINLEQYSEKQNRAISRILDSLDRLEKRMTTHYSNVRAHERKDFRGIVWISIPEQELGDDDVANTIKVWSRSISQSGLSFICPFPINYEEIHVGVPVQGDHVTWFRSQIVRRKEIEEEHFWEHGVRFLGKVVT